MSDVSPRIVEEVTEASDQGLPFLFNSFTSTDNRGSFKKLLSDRKLSLAQSIPQSATLLAQKVFTAEMEIFTSCSKKNVFRGLHYIKPFMGQSTSRVMTVSSGSALDILVNVDPNSPNYGCIFHCQLTVDGPSLFVPEYPIYAHGFLALEDNTSMTYIRSTPYCRELDLGYHYSLCLPLLETYLDCDQLVLSERDLLLPVLNYE